MAKIEHTYNEGDLFTQPNSVKSEKPKITNKRESVLYALDPQGKYVHIYDAKKDVEYRCPGCSGIVTPRNNDFEKRQYIKSYAHKGEVCKYYRETMLHLLSKEILLENKAVMLSDYKGLILSRQAKLQNVREEVWDEETQRRPDVVANLEDGTEIFIEIHNTNEVNEEKTQIFKEKGKTCLEIDVFNQEIDKDKLREFILNSAEERRWINAPRLEEEYKQKLESEGPIEKYIEEYGDLNNSFVRKNILKLIKKHFEIVENVFIFRIAESEVCRLAGECNLSRTKCNGLSKGKTIHFTQEYGIPQISYYEAKEVLRLSFNNDKYVFFIGFRPCKKEKLQNHAYIEIRNKQDIYGLLSGGLSVSSPNVQKGEAFPVDINKIEPNCKHPLFVLYRSGKIVTLDENINNSYAIKGVASLRIDADSLKQLHSTLGYDVIPTYSLQKLGVYLAAKNGIEVKNCMMCKQRRREPDYFSEVPSRCMLYGIYLYGQAHSIAEVCEKYEVNPVIPYKIDSILSRLKYQWLGNPNIQMDINKALYSRLFDELCKTVHRDDLPIPEPAIISAKEKNEPKVKEHSQVVKPKETIIDNMKLFSLFPNGDYNLKEVKTVKREQIKDENALLQLLFQPMNDEVLLAKSMDYCFKHNIPLNKCSYCNHLNKKSCLKSADKCLCERFSLNGDYTKLLWDNQNIEYEDITT